MKKSVIKKSVKIIWLAAFLSVLLSGILNYAWFASRETVLLDGERYTKEECRQAKKLIDMNRDEKTFNLFGAERLSEYIRVLRQVQEDRLVIVDQKVYNEEKVQEVLSHYSYSMEQAESAMKVIELCIRRKEAEKGYGQYVMRIHENLSNHKDVSIFSNGIKNLFVKANRDFYGLEDIKLLACTDAGLTVYLDGKIGIAVAFLFAVFGAMIFRMQFREGSSGETLWQGNSVWWYASAVIIGTIGIFMAEAFAAEYSWGLEVLLRPIQSVERFRSCPSLITVAALLAIRIFFRCIGTITIFCLCIFLFSLKKKWLSVLLGIAFLTTEVYLDKRQVPYTFYGQGFAENAFGTYWNAFIFDKPIPVGWLLSVFAGILFLCSVLLAAWQIRKLRLEAREKAEEQYFEQVDERYTQARILRHDMNNHLSAVSMLLKSGKTEDAQKYLDSVMEELEATKPPVRTGIGVLDAVLMGKDVKAKEKGIALTMEFDPVLQSVNIPDYELCSLFGNLLDNCLEACERLPEKDKWAHLRVTRQMDMICIFCENPFDELKKENGKIVTHKGDSTGHGLGIRQMERIAAKHGGTLEIETKDHVFSVSILFSKEEK